MLLSSPLQLLRSAVVAWLPVISTLCRAQSLKWWKKSFSTMIETKQRMMHLNVNLSQSAWKLGLWLSIVHPFKLHSCWVLIWSPDAMVSLVGSDCRAGLKHKADQQTEWREQWYRQYGCSVYRKLNKITEKFGLFPFQAWIPDVALPAATDQGCRMPVVRSFEFSENHN